MKCRDFYYLVCDFEENKVFSCGAKFSDFMKSIKIKPNNLLLLEASFGDGNYIVDLGFDYVDLKNMESLINDDVYGYGDFCWVDYDDFSIIKNISKMQLSELLYIRHRFEPLYKTKIDWLNNKYIYNAHDDDFWTRIYMEDIQEYKNVMHWKILDALKGRKSYIEPLPKDIIDYIFENSKYGILFDLENIYFQEGKTYLDIYKVGKGYNYDDIWDLLRIKETFKNVRIHLEYNNGNKKWKLSERWK